MRDLRWHHETVQGCLVASPDGDLNAETYREFRDGIVKAAVEQPRAIVVVLDGLRSASATGLAALSSAWMIVSDWPSVPIIAVAGDPALRADVRGGPVGRHVPVCADLPGALAIADHRPPQRRADVALVADAASSRQARAFVRATCLRWQVADKSLDAEEVATELVENSIIHASSDLRLRLELRDGVLTVAVSDDDAHEAVLHEPKAGQPLMGGLLLVAQLARVWGCAPRMSGGKVVWAVLAAVEGYPLTT